MNAPVTLDDVVLGLNREAARHLRCENQLAVVPGASWFSHRR